MQINRLFEMIYILLDKKTVTAKELAEKFEVSTRTIYRDIDILSSSNIPIYCTKGKNGGIRLLDNYVLDKSLVSEEEQNEIIFALQSLERLNVIDEKTVLDKMSRLFHKDTSNWIDIDFSVWGKKSHENDKFHKIKEAILNRRRISFVYYNSYGQTSKRTVEPLQIYFKDKAWYIKAYSIEKEDYRIFKIARMKEVEILDEMFDRTLEEEKVEDERDIPIIQIKMEISKELSFRVYDEFEEEEICKKENGDFIVTAKYPENSWVYDFILSFGEYATLLEPKYAIRILKEKIEKMSNKY